MRGLAQIFDPRAGTWEQATAGQEYFSAVPMWGPYYQQSPWAWSDLPQESFYSPRGGPFSNPFIPRRSGAFIQPGQADPLAYKLIFESGSLDGLSQAEAPKSQGSGVIKFAVGTWIALALLKAGVTAFLPPRKIRKLVRRVGTKNMALVGLVAAGGLTAWFLTRREQIPQLEVSLLGQGNLGQVGPWYVEDPTGGAYGGGGDPIYGDPLGPGESIAVANIWAGALHPKGFWGRA
jgi:hypothetical protein